MTKFDPRTEKFTHYARPAEMSPIGATYVNIDSKGNVWGVTRSGVLKLDPKKGQYTEYKSITPGGDHYGQAIDSTDTVWFTQMGKDRLGYVDGKTGRVGEVILSKSDLDATPLDLEVASRFDANNISSPPQIKGPRRMGADREGDSVWVAEYFADRLAQVNIHTKQVTEEYTVPRPYTQPYAVAVDRNHNVWISTFTDVVLRFDPTMKTFTEFPLSTRGTEARFIAVDNRTDPPTVWVPYWRANKIARLQFKRAR